VEVLRGRNALVTGAGGGLGGYIARALAAEGANLALTDLQEAPIVSLADELGGRGISVGHLTADLAEGAERQRLMAWAGETLGPVDILVNNAGLEYGGSFVSLPPEELQAIVQVNLVATMDLTRIALPGMLGRGRGHVVNVASLAGKVPAPYLAAYSGTKHGIVGFTHALRTENGDHPVGFSAICPSFVSRVGMWARFEDQISAPGMIGTVTPEAVGEAVVRAIRKNLAEVIVSTRPVRPLVWLNAAAPRLASKVGRMWLLRDFSEQYARVRGRP
jgi:short-subunit dehydrogenase